MSTHSVVSIMRGDKIESIYVHWDGYLSYVGVVLQKYYDLKKTNELMKLGNISSLGAEIGEQHDFDQKISSYKEDNTLHIRVASVCTAYGRDRREVDQQSKVHETVNEMINYYDEEHYYAMDEAGVWYYSSGRDRRCNKEWVLLSDAIEEDAESAQ